MTFFGKICLGGFPGIGSVGKFASDYLGQVLECQTFLSIGSPGFPPQVIISGNIAHPFLAHLGQAARRDDLILISCDAQPLHGLYMNALAGDILEELAGRGVRDVITLGAYVGGQSDKVLAASTDPSGVALLEAEGMAIIRQGFIGGMNGLLAGMAPQHGMRGFCLLGTTSGQELVDLEGARNLVSAVSHILKLDMPLLDFASEEEMADEEILPEKPDDQVDPSYL
ncbi:MAG: PAC2 family protein [Methanosaeta sp. PtaB.Bin039]|nr:MAG: PAC2 family protein [Methanosaeta sp. PtaB.Bin039]HOT06573.1 PAC2 family protein [Methanotrichaceae archaeon]HQF16545.1 PAC2 family protein [Methanotrichaceae archaeon]HQI91084.1 PAC2 family protein [Methanotrichaceae archaeon]HQJ28525.1 PAC2 family protein [Methanotrichaceae archaeon]